MSIWLDTQTPQLTANDSRGLPVRQIAYWREDLGEPDARVTLQNHDVAGRLVAQRDPRLMAEPPTPANLVSIYSLSGKVLSTVSVDAGWRVGLFGEADQAVSGWDGRGSQRRTEYDDQIRQIAVFEQAADSEVLCTERFAYGGGDPAFSTRNQCGQLIRHDDPSGTQLFEQFGLAGEVLQQTRHFLQTLESPDWPEPIAERDTLLEPGAGFKARARFNSLGEAIEQIDARGNRQFSIHTLAGQLREVRLQLAKDVAPKVLVSAIQYNALGQTVRETAGNGVITLLEYAAEDGRLTRLQAKRGSGALQDLRYAYDSVGNVLSIEDAALPVRYFANQRVEPVNRYVYDSLYQLINATGWEAGGSNQGPTFSRFDDPASCANYSQSYCYDRGGNLLELTHDGPQSHGHRLVAAAQSNRCLPVINGVEPSEEDFRNSFDSSGNLLNLQPGQSLRWDLRNQLCEVSPVANDRERYVYGADGMRVRKVHSAQTNARTLISEVRYLPGLELRTHSGTGEALQVITVQAGRSSVRVLHWESEPPKDIANDQYRYSLNDHLGSCVLELDNSGDIISQERYHPFGTTAWFAWRSEIEAGYKTVRYSGKERDATGLLYYGLRYYVPWLQRWLNPDPLLNINGLNILIFSLNSPIVHIDRNGGVSEEILMGYIDTLHTEGGTLVSPGFEMFTMTQATRFEEGTDIAQKIISGTILDLKKSRLSNETYKSLAESVGLDFMKNDENTPGKPFIPELAKNLTLIKNGLDRIKSEDFTRVLFIEFPPNNNRTGEYYGTDTPNDNDAIIAISFKHFETASLLSIATTIIHEVSHWALGTEDYYYQEDLIERKYAPGSDSTSLFKDLSTKGLSILNTAPNESQMEDDYIREQYSSTISAITPDALDDNARSNAFKKNFEVRKRILLGNADFYPNFSTSVYYRNRPQAMH